MIENLRSMAVFVAVVEEGSFRAAGEKLRLSSSVVSHHVSSLEKRLGRVLLQRSSRQLALTDQGSILFHAARDMVASAEMGLAELNGDASKTDGILRVSAPRFLSGGIVVELVEDFLLSHPKVSMELEFTLTQKHPINDRFDLIIGVDRIDNPAICVKELTGVKVGFYAAPDLAERVQRLPRHEIAEKIPLLFSSGFITENWVSSISGPLPKPDADLPFRLKCDDIGMLHKMCCSGVGLAVLPHTRARVDVTSGRLVPVLEDISFGEEKFFAHWAKRKPSHRLIRRFLSHIEAQLEYYQSP